MKTTIKKTAGPFTAGIQKAYAKVHGRTGISKEDLFAAALGYAAVGLIAVNVNFLPQVLHVVGWTAVFSGLAGMIFVRRIL